MLPVHSSHRCEGSPSQRPDAPQFFSSRIGSLRKALRSRAEFFFVDAPSLARPEAAWTVDENGDARPVGRTWWDWTVRSRLRVILAHDPLEARVCTVSLL